MRLDYNEKKMGRESVERKPVAKNRPRKEPMGLFAILSIFALVVTYGAGVATGWILYKVKAAKAPAVQVAPAVKVAEPAPPQPPAPYTPLTFYKTLPQGEKGVIGSGVNLKPPQPPGHAAPVAAPAVPPAAATPAPPSSAAPAAKQDAQPKPQGAEKQDKQQGADKAQEAQQKSEAQQKQEKQDARYVVQVASYRDKQEAEAAQAKLTAKGVAAYLVESKLADKTVWYRLRIGKHLSKAEATQLAGRTGKGAAVIAE